MCETCNHFSGIDRREFLKVSGSAVVLSSLGTIGALAQSSNKAVTYQPIPQKRTKIAIVFMYPPAEVVNEGRLEDSWAVNKWFTYPGNQYEPEMNHEKFRNIIDGIGATYALDIDYQGVIYTKAQLASFIDSMFAYTGTMAGNPEINTAGGCATRFIMDIDRIDDVCSTYQGPHPILYFGNPAEAKRLKMFAKLANLKFTGNI